MWKNRGRPRVGMALLLLVGLSQAAIADLEQVEEKRALEIAVYAHFPPYSEKRGGQPKGIDVAIGRALAEKLGVPPTFRVFPADESMADDFRNQLWKGHYLGGGVADVMVHVPVDSEYAKRNDQVLILGPYHQETIVVARDPRRLGNTRTLDGFITEKIGVELLTLPSEYLLSAFGGRLQENVVHYRSVAQAAEALRRGEVAGVMAPRGELEAALGSGRAGFAVGPMPMPGVRRTRWDLGLAVKADRRALASALETAMSELRSNGTVERIFQEYGISYSPPDRAVLTANATK